MIQKIVESRIDVVSDEFILPEGTRAIKSVSLNGVSTRDFVFDGVSKLKIFNLNPEQKAEITVEYY